MKNDLLRNARVKRGWSQQQLAEQIGVGESTVRSWESGRHAPSLELRVRLCELFGMTPEQLGLPSPGAGSPTVPVNGPLDAEDADAPEPIHDLLDPFEQDASLPTFKKKKMGRSKIVAALVSILTVVILILYFMVPGLSLSSTGKAAAPSPTPRTDLLTSHASTPTIRPTSTIGPPPTIAPTPTPGASLPSLITIFDLGPLNFQGYCLASGDTGAALDQNNAWGWRCVGPDGSHFFIFFDEACQSQYQRSDTLSRMVNYSDPNDWHCYARVRQLGGVNFAGYCQSLGLEASLVDQTAYGWRCSASSTDSGQLIDVNKACLQQYKVSESIASVTDPFDPTHGWRCLGPLG